MLTPRRLARAVEREVRASLRQPNEVLLALVIVGIVLALMGA